MCVLLRLAKSIHLWPRHRCLRSWEIAHDDWQLAWPQLSAIGRADAEWSCYCGRWALDLHQGQDSSVNCAQNVSARFVASCHWHEQRAANTPVSTLTNAPTPNASLLVCLKIVLYEDAISVNDHIISVGIG